MRVLVLFLAWVGCCATAAAAGCQYPYGVGYRVETIGAMRVALWYPTLAAPADFAYSDRLHGSVAVGATPGCARVPLVVFSHGLGGCGTQSIYFTEELARHGYVVAAPDHADAVMCTIEGGHGNAANLRPAERFRSPAQWSDATYADRRDDLVETIDELLADPVFGRVIDPGAVGAAGHSLGGYTVVGIAGAWPTWKDARVKAVVAMSPYVSPFVLDGTLPGLTVPIMYQGAQLDAGITPTLEGPRGAYALTSPPKYFAKLHGGTHYAWTNVACRDAGTVQQCLAKPNPSIVDAYAIAFFDRYLKGEASPLLGGNDAGLADYRFVP